MEYYIKRTVGGSVVKNKDGAALASFSNDLEGQALQGHLVHRLAQIGATIFDETRNEYLAGTIDQLQG